jgi:benzoyl-CoA reductase/2-hydroxyglutaryl-CoA dehydratase subunit BcrC/BadD/HgdB
MVDNCLAYATRAKAQGRPIVGIMCEYTPREIIMAAGGVPVCLCGGDVGTIAAAEEHLPSNLCPLIKSTYGHHVLGSNPFLAMADLLVAETTCDGKKKMFELLGEQVPSWVLELPQKERDEDAFQHWLAELRKLRKELERRFGVVITDERIREAIREMNRERKLRRDIAFLMTSDAPPLTGRELLEMRTMISSIPEDLARLEETYRRLAAMGPDARSRGKVRVMLTGVPVARGAEKVMEVVESHGGLIVCQENCTGLKPIMEDVDPDAPDVILALADKYYRLPCSVMTRNNRRMELLRQLAQQFRPQCVVDLVWQACITYDVESVRVKRFVEGELGIPYLRVETDYSPSDVARIATRVEALFETAQNAAAGLRP